MLSRVAFLLIELFSATMNILFWLSEFCGHTPKIGPLRGRGGGSGKDIHAMERLLSGY